MLFTAHTWRPAMRLVFLLSRTASTASAFLTGELPRFGVESLWLAVPVCDCRTFHVLHGYRVCMTC